MRKSVGGLVKVLGVITLTGCTALRDNRESVEIPKKPVKPASQVQIEPPEPKYFPKDFFGTKVFIQEGAGYWIYETEKLVMKTVGYLEKQDKENSGTNKLKRKMDLDKVPLLSQAESESLHLKIAGEDIRIDTPEAKSFYGDVFNTYRAGDYEGVLSMAGITKSAPKEKISSPHKTAEKQYNEHIKP